MTPLTFLENALRTHDAVRLNHVNGLYMYQGGSIFINLSKQEVLQEMARFGHFQTHGIGDFREVQYHLVQRHENNHFLQFLSSPYCAFTDDICDFHMSNLVYALQHTLDYLPRRVLHKPVAQMYLDPKCNIGEKGTDRLNRSVLTSVALHGMLFDNPTIGQMIYLINNCIELIANSKGISINSVATVKSRYPSDRRVSSRDWTVLNIVEALARAAEMAILDGFHASPRAVEKWYRAGLFHKSMETYSTVYLSLLRPYPLDLMVVLLISSLRGSFFPFVGRHDVYLEDFHPVMLLERMIPATLGKIDLTLDDSNVDSTFIQAAYESAKTFFGHHTSTSYRQRMEAACRHMWSILVRDFSLVTDSAPFESNQKELERKFADAFPQVAASFQFRNYLLERQRLSALRKINLSQEAKDIVKVIHNPPVYSDRFLVSDCIFSNNDAALEKLYKANKGPLLALDRRLLNTAVGEWLVFGQTSLLKQWEQVAATLNSHYGGEQMPCAQDMAAYEYRLAEVPTF